MNCINASDRKAPRKFTDEEKCALVKRWVKLRETMGATEAAREIGMGCEALRLWSKTFGLEVPSPDLMLTMGLPQEEMEERANKTLRWKALREAGVPPETAAERVGLSIKKIYHCARVRGIEIGHLAGRGKVEGRASKVEGRGSRAK